VAISNPWKMLHLGLTDPRLISGQDLFTMVRSNFFEVFSFNHGPSVGAGYHPRLLIAFIQGWVGGLLQSGWVLKGLPQEVALLCLGPYHVGNKGPTGPKFPEPSQSRSLTLRHPPNTLVKFLLVLYVCMEQLSMASAPELCPRSRAEGTDFLNFFWGN
jgi:hypothetical protein